MIISTINMKNMKTLKNKIEARDIIGVIGVVGALVCMGLGIDKVVSGILIMIIAFYFGLNTTIKKDNGQDNTA